MTTLTPISADDAAAFMTMLGSDETDRTVYPAIEALYWDARLAGMPRRLAEVVICPTDNGLIISLPGGGAIDMPLESMQVASTKFGAQGFLLIRSEGEANTYSMPASAAPALEQLLIGLGASGMHGRVKGRKVARRGSDAWA